MCVKNAKRRPKIITDGRTEVRHVLVAKWSWPYRGTTCAGREVIMAVQRYDMCWSRSYHGCTKVWHVLVVKLSWLYKGMTCACREVTMAVQRYDMCLSWSDHGCTKVRHVLIAKWPWLYKGMTCAGREVIMAVQRYDMRWSRSDHVITLEVPDSSIFFTKYFYVKRLPHLLTLDTDLFLFLTQDKILTLNPRFEVQMLMSSHRKFHGSSTFF